MSYKFKVDPTVRRKLGLVKRCLPVKSVIDFGGMWEVDGYYSKQCLDKFGIKRVTMIDAEESDNWRADPTLREGLDFRKGDFSDEGFIKSIPQSYDLAMAYDVLVSQIDLRHTLSLMLSKVDRYFLIANPVIQESVMPYRNALVLLSGSRASSLIPFHQQWTKEIDYWRNFRDASNTSWHHLLWGMTPSFVESLMAGLNWRLVHREVWKDPFLQNPRWRMGGFIFAKGISRSL
jgi:hypothetical protein